MRTLRSSSLEEYAEWYVARVTEIGYSKLEVTDNSFPKNSMSLLGNQPSRCVLCG